MNPTIAPVDAEARAELVARLLGVADARGLNNAQAAKAAGVRRADFSQLRNAKTDGYSLGWLMQALVTIAPELRVRVVVEPAAPSASPTGRA